MDEDRTRTLVVTVDPGLIQQIRTALEGHGGPVRPCPTAEGATAELHEQTYGLAVVSTELPDVDGFEAARTFSAIDPGLQVVLLGEDRDGRGVEAAAAVGAAAFIQRPLKVVELRQRLREVMGAAWGPSPGKGTGSVHAESLVDPATGVFPADTGYEVSVLDDEESREPSATSTQDLPVVNIQAFDEHNPVSIPVGATVTAHGLEPVRVSKPPPSADDEALDGADPDPAAHAGSDEALDGADPDPANSQTPASPPDPVQDHVEQLLAPGGALAGLIDEAVQRAVARALAEQLPAALARLSGDSE